MADIQPFRGLRYNNDKIGDISSVISPPYDVISPKEQQLYYQQSSYNVIRLELGVEEPSDSVENNRHTRAAGTLRKWIDDGILIQEQKPALYVFAHHFIHHGVTKCRWEITARVRLEDWNTGVVRPHEATMEEHIKERLNLVRHCRANLSPVMGMFRHEQEGFSSLFPRLTRKSPDVSVVDRYGITHQMWVVTDEPNIARVSTWCAGKPIYIADGHHRYKTALAYQREQKTLQPNYTGNEAFDFVMMTLMDAGDSGVVALPTHRMVRLPEPQGLANLKEEIGRFFDLEDVKPCGPTWHETLNTWLDRLKEQGKKGVALGLYGLDEKHLCMIKSQQKAKLQAMLPSEYSQDLKDLDLTLLNWIILRNIMGIVTPGRGEEYLAYTRDEQEAISRVNSGEFHLAFLVNPVPVSGVLAVADAGNIMPPKSTYFYPKPPTGLVINPLWKVRLSLAESGVLQI